MKNKFMSSYLMRSLILFMGGMLILTGTTLHAFDEYNNTAIRDHAISGYDPVAYFTEGKPLKGSTEYQYKWGEAVWLFANAKHLKLFKVNPKKYAPQYGGYCAWAIAAKGKLYDIDPDVWKIVDGKLYLNYSKKIGKRWEADMPKFIKKGNLTWKKMIQKQRSKS